MYDKCGPKQRAGLIYGYKLRGIYCLVANAQSYCKGEIQTFTKEELQQLHTIKENALSRARMEHEEARRRIETTTTTTDSGIASESRKYTGK